MTPVSSGPIRYFTRLFINKISETMSLISQRTVWKSLFLMGAQFVADVALHNSMRTISMLSSHVCVLYIAARRRRALQAAIKSQVRGKVPGGLARAVGSSRLGVRIRPSLNGG
jgi:hypothetical protein